MCHVAAACRLAKSLALRWGELFGSVFGEYICLGRVVAPIPLSRHVVFSGICELFQYVIAYRL